MSVQENFLAGCQEAIRGQVAPGSGLESAASGICRGFGYAVSRQKVESGRLARYLSHESRFCLLTLMAASPAVLPWAENVLCECVNVHSTLHLSFQPALLSATPQCLTCASGAYAECSLHDHPRHLSWREAAHQGMSSCQSEIHILLLESMRVAWH